MENKLEGFDDSVKSPLEGSGSILAAARKEQKKSVEEIAAELNLSITQIKTIELDQSEGLPEPTYVRGYIRSYARLLGLDAEKVLESYLNSNWQKGSSLDEMPKGIGNADDAKTNGFFKPGKVVAIICVLGIVAISWLSGFLPNLLNSFDKSVDAVPVTNSEPVQEESIVSPVVNTQSSVSENSQNDNIQSSDALNEGGIQSQESQTSLTQQAIETSDDVASASEENAVSEEPVIENNLILKFVETCWVDVRDGDDNRLAYKSYYTGEELVVPNEGVLNVFLGNADGVVATYNGEPFDMSPYREGVYAKFSLRKN